jgi:hypothetical protein
MRFRVLLEIDAPDPGTPTGDGGTTSSPEKWIWQDFFKEINGPLQTQGVTVVTVKEAIIILPGFCGNCERQVAFFDYLCNECRIDSVAGTPRYEQP